MWNLKYGTNEPTYKTETDSNIKNRFVVAKGERGGRKMDWEFEVGRCQLLHLEWISKVLMYSIVNCIQYYAINHNGKEYFKR